MFSPLLAIMDSIPKQLVENNIKDIKIFMEEQTKGISIEIAENISQNQFPVTIPPEKCQKISQDAKEVVKNRK